MDLQELFNLASGVNEDKTNKSSIAITTMFMDGETEEVDETFSYASAAPVVKIENRSNYVQIDLVFDHHLNEALRVIWATLEKYGQDLSENADETYDIPILLLTVVPLSLKGVTNIAMFNPIIWTLQPENPLAETANTIRLLFNTDDVYEASNNDISIEQITAELDSEESTAAYLETIAEQKEEEEREFWEQRNRYKNEMDNRTSSTLKNAEEDGEKQRRSY